MRYKQVELLHVIYVLDFGKLIEIILGIFHFIVPANSHTYTPPTHSGITRLSQLVCFSRANFVNHVKVIAKTIGLWRAVDGRYGSEINPSGCETSIRPSRPIWAYNWHFLNS